MTIEGYRFGQVVIDGRTYSSDVIIYHDHIDDGWWRQEGHAVCADDLPEVLADPPEVLVVGRGAPGLMRVRPELRQQLEQAGVELIEQPTEQACETYNRLAGERRVIAALHLTC